MPPPERVRDNHDLVPAGTIFLRGKGASLGKRKGEQSKVIGARLHFVQLRRRVTTCQIHLAALPCAHVLKEIGLAKPYVEFVGEATSIPSGTPFEHVTTRSGSGVFSGLSSIVLTREKTAVFAPIPRARADMAVVVKIGVRRSVLIA